MTGVRKCHLTYLLNSWGKKDFPLAPHWWEIVPEETPKRILSGAGDPSPSLHSPSPPGDSSMLISDPPPTSQEYCWFPRGSGPNQPVVFGVWPPPPYDQPCPKPRPTRVWGAANTGPSNLNVESNIFCANWVRQLPSKQTRETLGQERKGLIRGPVPLSLFHAAQTLPLWHCPSSPQLLL